jgi:hypothetical protein
VISSSSRQFEYSNGTTIIDHPLELACTLIPFLEPLIEELEAICVNFLLKSGFSKSIKSL